MANSVIQRPLGALAAAISRFQGSLYQPPQTRIDEINPGAWPSPLQPLAPIGPKGSEPIAFNFWMGQNLTYTPRPDAEIDFRTLRMLATYPLARYCIENARDQICQMEWAIQPKRLPGETLKDHKARAGKDQTVVQISRFLEWPDSEHTWDDWARPLLDDMLVIDAACYSDDIDVLTKRGWLRFKDVTLLDECGTRSEDGRFEWQRPTELIVKQYDGELLHFTGRNTDMLVTPNHNMLAAPLSSVTYNTKKPPAKEWRKSQFGHPGTERLVRYKLIAAADLSKKLSNRAFPATSRWSAPDLPEFRLEIHRQKPQWKKEQCVFSCSGDEFFAFMGMWLSEGCAPSNGAAKIILVSQQPYSKGFGAFKDLLEGMRGKAHHNGKVFRFHNVALWRYLKQFGHATEKFVPEIIKNGSARQIQVFLEYFALGDGHFRRRVRSLKKAAFTTSSRRLADDLQELCQKIGLSASIRPKKPGQGVIRGRKINAGPCFNVYVRSTKAVQYRKVSRIPYSGPVFCVTVPNHTLYVRRNGFPMWCGNSVYLRRTKKGQVAELRYVPGDFIARYIDDNGFTPAPPSPAYAQLWEGIPRVNLTTNQLVYKPRNIVFRNTVSSMLYGFPPTEQARLDIEFGASRLESALAYYKDGDVPTAVQMVPGDTPADKIKEAMEWMSSDLAGNLAKRRKWRMMQSFASDGKTDTVHFPPEPKLVDETDENHIRRICFAYGTSPQRMVRALNRASAEQADTAAQDEGTMPWANWTQRLINFIIQRKMGFVDYEFIFKHIQEQDILKQMEAQVAGVAGLLVAPNEGRQTLGLDPFDDPRANKIGVKTGTGWIAIDEQEAANQAAIAGKNGAGGEGGEGEQGAPSSFANYQPEPAPKRSQKKTSNLADPLSITKYDEDEHPRGPHGEWIPAGGRRKPPPKRRPAQEPAHPARQQAQPKQPPERGRTSIARERALSSSTNEKPVRVSTLSGGSNEVQMLTLKDGTKVVFKPASGEGHGHEEEGSLLSGEERIPSFGSQNFMRDNITPGMSAEREVAAWEVAKLVGMDDLVTPSILAKVSGQHGALMEFQQGRPAFAIGGDRMFDGEKDLNRAAVFDFVIGNEDRHAGNWLVANGKLRLIDHGLAFPEEPYHLGNREFEQAQMDRPNDVVYESESWKYVQKQPQILAALRSIGLPAAAIAGVKERLGVLKRSSDLRQARDILSDDSQ